MPKYQRAPISTKNIKKNIQITIKLNVIVNLKKLRVGPVVAHEHVKS